MDFVTTYIPLFLKNQLNVGIFETGMIYSGAVVGGVIGTIFLGHLADRFGSLRTAVVILEVSTVATFLLLFYKSFGLLLLLHIFLIGVTRFSFSSLLQAQLTSTSTPEQRDLVLGLFFTIGFGTSSVLNALTGFLVDTYGSFEAA